VTLLFFCILQMQAAWSETRPLVTDVLPSGVPLPAPAPAFEPPLEDPNAELLGDAYGVRPWLRHYGVHLNIQDVEELWGLAAGGLHPGPTYDGITAVTLQIETDPLFGWQNGLLNVSALQIRGRSFTGERLQALNSVSGYDVGRSTRLFEIWYGQGFLSNSLDLRVGSIDLDTEFLVSSSASFFLNASFGWPLSTSSNLYSGGPSWPFSAVGGRVKWSPASPFVLMGAVTNDNPTHGPFYSNIAATQRDPSGTSFSTAGGALFMGEAQYQLNMAPRRASGKEAGLPGTWKIGGLYDTGHFPDQRYGSHRVPLASPESSGTPLYHRGNWLAYAVVDQMIWRDSRDARKTINIFMRATTSDTVRNIFAHEIQAGVTFDGMIRGHRDDTIGVAWGTSFYTTSAEAHARDAIRFGTSTTGQLRQEHHVEITYQAAMTPWLILQPDFQYFRNVGGTSLSSETGRPVRDGFVLGLNMTTTL